MGSLCALLIAGFDPEACVIGQGVIVAGGILLSPTRESMNRLTPFNGKRPSPVIVPAKLGNDAGLVGVADLARS